MRTACIGFPDQVKKILLTHCTDLKRDRCHQDWALPNRPEMPLHS